MPGRRLVLPYAVSGRRLLAGRGSSANKATDGKVRDGATAPKPVAADSAAGTNESATAGPVRVSLTQAQYEVAAIRLAQPRARTLSTTLKVNGTLDVPAQNLVSVSVPFGGYIRQIRLEPGMRIRKGQTLAVLENPDYIQFQQDYLVTKAKLEYADLEFAPPAGTEPRKRECAENSSEDPLYPAAFAGPIGGHGPTLGALRINPAKLPADHLIRTIGVPSPVMASLRMFPSIMAVSSIRPM